jgi:hypothetical protein
MTDGLKLRLEHALTDPTSGVTDGTIADEVVVRLGIGTPASSSAAATSVALLNSNLNDNIINKFIIALTDDAFGSEVSGKLNTMIDVLQAKADEVAAVAASFTGQVAGMTTDVTIDADNAGAAGNVTLVFDGIDDIDDVILAWNTANPTNTVTLSSGDGTQVPNAGNIVLAGGSDASAPNLATAKAAMGSTHMSDGAFERLVSALGDRAYATEFKTLYNTMIDNIQATTV